MRKVLVIGIILLIATVQSYACRYTIREIGFSELFIPKYQLVLEADTVSSKSLIKDFRSIAFAYSMEANVTYKVVGAGNSHATIHLLSEKGDTLLKKEVKTRDDIVATVTGSLGSASREELIEKLGNAFAVVLYVEGKDGSGQNHRSIRRAIREFEKVAVNLDKEVKESVQLIEIEYQKRNEEQILLRCLGLPESAQQPVVAVLYGRGRLAGEALVGNNISYKEIFNKLVLIGTDCECGVDLSPLLKKAIPLNWDGNIKAQVAEMLSVDVDNPMTLTEMSKILAKGTTDSIQNTEALVNRVFEIADNQEPKDDFEEVKEEGEVSILLKLFGILGVIIVAIGVLLYRRRTQ